jgi:hypothetical protein
MPHAASAFVRLLLRAYPPHLRQREADVLEAACIECAAERARFARGKADWHVHIAGNVVDDRPALRKCEPRGMMPTIVNGWRSSRIGRPIAAGSPRK